MDVVDILLRILRVSVRSFVATRYIVSFVVGVVVLCYAGLWLAGYVPDYVTLAQRVNLRSRVLFYLLYLAVAVVTALIWVLISRKLGDAAKKHIDVRWLFRHTDRTGVTAYGIALVIATTTIYFLLGGVTTIARDVVAFLAIVVILPLILDFVPTGPRRVVVRDKDMSPRDIMEELDYHAYWAQVKEYNRKDSRMREALDHESKSLPEGIVLEIPPSDLMAALTENQA